MFYTYLERDFSRDVVGEVKLRLKRRCQLLWGEVLTNRLCGCLWMGSFRFWQIVMNWWFFECLSACWLSDWSPQWGTCGGSARPAPEDDPPPCWWNPAGQSKNSRLISSCTVNFRAEIFVRKYLKTHPALLNELLLKDSCSITVSWKLVKTLDLMGRKSEIPSSFLRKGNCFVKAFPGRFGTLIWTVLVTWIGFIQKGELHAWVGHWLG